MGGKALNRFGVTTERKTTEEFLRIGNELQERLGFDLGVITEIIQCYRTKADHGDLDLLVKMEEPRNPFGFSWKDYIQTTFKPQAINSNGGVYSFDYQNFQIDIIPIPEDKWETAKTYYGWDPLGNISGKTFHKFDLSYGWEGLYYKFRNFYGSVSKDVLISTDVRKIFEFGGYDYDKYLKGFDTLEEIFNFCIDGKYFDSEMFKFENLKSIDKKRNRKRGSYHLFLKYIEEHGINREYEFQKDKDLYLPLINEFFPEAKLMEKLEDLQKIDDQNKIISSKFSGHHIMKWLPDIKGKEMSVVIEKFKNGFDDIIKYREFLLTAGDEEIYKRFMDSI